MGWLEYEELRKIRENQERSDFERWQRDNPGEAEYLRQQNEASVEEIRRKNKEEEEAKSKSAKKDTVLGLVTVFAFLFFANLSNPLGAACITVVFAILWLLLKNNGDI